MSNRFMITVAAAALIAGTGFANAQGIGGGREGGTGGAGMQQSAPSSPSTGASGVASQEGSSGMRSSQSEEKGGAANRSAQQEMKPGGEKGAMGEKSTGQKSAQENREKGAAGKDMKAEDHERNGNMKAEGQERNGSQKAESRDNNRTAGAKEGRSATVGQAGAGAKLNTEQRTKITTVIRNEHVAPVTNVNFSVSIGTRVPREVGFHPLPTEIVTIYPEWRGYEFFLVRDQIVVVDPRTLEIVAVLEA